jgi:hypothetical protein
MFYYLHSMLLLPARRFQHDLSEVMSMLQQPNQLKDAVKDLYLKHVTGEVKASGLEEDVQAEYDRCHPPPHMIHMDPPDPLLTLHLSVLGDERGESLQPGEDVQAQYDRCPPPM